MKPALRRPLQSSRLLDQVRERIRYCHYSIRTETAYVYWVRDFVRFSGRRHPRELGGPEVQTFLTHLAAQRRVSPCRRCCTAPRAPLSSRCRTGAWRPAQALCRGFRDRRRRPSQRVPCPGARDVAERQEEQIRVFGLQGGGPAFRHGVVAFEMAGDVEGMEFQRRLCLAHGIYPGIDGGVRRRAGCRADGSACTCRSCNCSNHAKSCSAWRTTGTGRRYPNGYRRSTRPLTERGARLKPSMQTPSLDLPTTSHPPAHRRPASGTRPCAATPRDTRGTASCATRCRSRGTHRASRRCSTRCRNWARRSSGLRRAGASRTGGSRSRVPSSRRA